jgi:flagellar motor component MotA
MDTKVTLQFPESEVKWIEPMLMKYFGCTKKTKTKKELKRLLEMFISIMFSKGMYALEHNEDYMEVK